MLPSKLDSVIDKMPFLVYITILCRELASVEKTQLSTVDKSSLPMQMSIFERKVDEESDRSKHFNPNQT